MGFKKDYRKQPFRKNFRKNFERRDSRFPENIDWADIETRGVYHNRIVEELVLYTPSKRLISVNTGSLMIYTLTPSKPKIYCQYMVPITDNRDEKSGGTTTFICQLDEKIDELCYLTEEKILSHRCFGQKTNLPSMEFWIITNGKMSINKGETKDFKIGLFNKYEPNIYRSLKCHENPIEWKRESLKRVNYMIKNGGIQIGRGPPKPGNILFHTLFSGKVDVEIENIFGDIIKGTVFKYENTPGGFPLLHVYSKVENGKGIDPFNIVSLDTISTMIIDNYEIENIIKKRTIELIMRGHISIPHGGEKGKKDYTMILDFCKRYKMGEDQKITPDGRITPISRDIDDHDADIKDVINKIK